MYPCRHHDSLQQVSPSQLHLRASTGTYLPCSSLHFLPSSDLPVEDLQRAGTQPHACFLWKQVSPCKGNWLHCHKDEGVTRDLGDRQACAVYLCIQNLCCVYTKPVLCVYRTCAVCIQNCTSNISVWVTTS
jgi:hypothetical protein